MPSKWCLFDRDMALNGQYCLLIYFSDVHFSLTVRFRTAGPQNPNKAVSYRRPFPFEPPICRHDCAAMIPERFEHAAARGGH